MSAVKQNKALDFMKDYALYFVLLLLLVVIISKDASFLSLTNFSNVFNPIFGPHHHCVGRGRSDRYPRYRLVGGPPSRIGSSDFCHIAAGGGQCE